MNSIGGEVIGDLAQSALAARAVEPGHGEGQDGHSHEAACLNCGTALLGSHCHNCGQAAHVHRTLGAFFHDLLHGVFHFEGKIWRTLPKLAFKPGVLTREYIDGRRASYVSPIALFLFSVFLMFAVVKQVAGHFGDLSSVDVNGVTVTGLAENEKVIARLKARRAELVKAGQPTDAVDGEIAGREQAVAAIKQMRGEFSVDQIAQAKDARYTSDVPAIQPTERERRTFSAISAPLTRASSSSSRARRSSPVVRRNFSTSSSDSSTRSSSLVVSAVLGSTVLAITNPRFHRSIWRTSS